MLLKLIKHDLLSFLNYIMYMYFVLFAYTLALNYLFLPFANENLSDYMLAISLLYPFTIIIFYIFIFKKIMSSTNEMLYGPSSYLLFSVPASTHAIILHKFITNVFWLMTLVLATITAFRIVDLSEYDSIFNFSDIFPGFESSWRDIPIFYFLATVTTLLLITSFFILLSMLSQALVHTWYKGKYKRIVALFMFIMFFTLFGRYMQFIVDNGEVYMDAAISTMPTEMLQKIVMALIIFFVFFIWVAFLYFLLYKSIHKKLEINQ